MRLARRLDDAEAWFIKALTIVQAGGLGWRKPCYRKISLTS
jgi:hypothetical protein